MILTRLYFLLSHQCSAQTEIDECAQVFTNLIRVIQQTQTELIGMMEEKQKATERRAEGLIKDLENEIAELQTRNAELKRLSHTDDHIHFLQVSEIFYQTTGKVNTSTVVHNADVFLASAAVEFPLTVHPSAHQELVRCHCLH